MLGTVVEFYGILLQDGVNAYAASRAGADEHWIGSDIGWITFGLGMLVLLPGASSAPLALHRRGTAPWWLAFFAATLGVGVLAGNVFGLAPGFLSVPVLAVHAAGWSPSGGSCIVQPSFSMSCCPADYNGRSFWRHTRCCAGGRGGMRAICVDLDSARIPRTGADEASPAAGRAVSRSRLVS